MASIASLRGRLAVVPAPMRAALLMTCYALFASLANGIARHLGQTLPAIESTFFLHLFAMLVVLPARLRKGAGDLGTTRHGLFLVRGMTVAFYTVCFIYALALLPVDKATALHLTVPIFTTFGAALCLRERVGVRRWGAVALGAAGGLVILRPGLAGYEPGSIFALMSAAAIAANLLMVRSLARTEPPHRVVFYMGAYAAPFTLVPTLLVWVTPGPAELAWAALMGALTGVGQLLATRAFSLAEASFVAPFDLFRLLFGALVGFLAFGELMDALSWLGAGVIITAAFYITHREARLKARAAPSAR